MGTWQGEQETHAGEDEMETDIIEWMRHTERTTQHNGNDMVDRSRTERYQMRDPIQTWKVSSSVEEAMDQQWTCNGGAVEVTSHGTWQRPFRRVWLSQSQDDA